MEQQEQQAQRSTATNVDSAIPNSDPSQIDRLWSAVRTASRSDAQDTATMDYDSTTIKPAHCDGTVSGSDAQDDTTMDFESTTIKSAHYDDPDYKATVLTPRGIQIFQSLIGMTNEDSFEHFKTEIAPKSGKAAHYQKLLSPEIDLFVDGGPAFNERLVGEYKTGKSGGYDKRRWANLAITFLLRQDVMNLNRQKTGTFTAERRDEESITPIPNRGWSTLPILAEDEDTMPYDFSLVPDTVYWLSLQAFTLTWTSAAARCTYIYRDRALLPYLSVEYGQYPWNDKAVQIAVNKMTSIAAICQYNRYKLRKRIKKETRTGDIEWSTADDAAIRHYGMTICGHKWEVYLAAPQATPKGKWTGTDIRIVGFGDLQYVEGVERCVNWINEIHLWGLGVYAQNVKNEIETLVEKREESRRLRGESSAL